MHLGIQEIRGERVAYGAKMRSQMIIAHMEKGGTDGNDEEQKAPEHDMDPEEKKILEKLTRMAEEIKRREQNIENRSV